MKKYLWLFGMLLPALFVGSVLAGEKPEDDLVVSSKGNKGEYSTIAKAIEAAGPGAVIHVKPGTYRESLIIDKPVTIIGEGKPERIIVESTDAACIISTADNAGVKNITLRCKAQEDYGVDISDGSLTLEDCNISAEGLACLAIHGAQTNPVIKNCQIHQLQIGRNGGIFVYEQGRGVIVNCKIYENKLAGIEIKDGGNPKVSGCEIYSNLDAGIFAHERGLGTITDCKIYGNTAGGIEIYEDSDLKVSGCMVYKNLEDGLFVEQGQGTISDCQIYENKLSGVEIRKNGNPTVSGCNIYKNLAAGVYVYDQGRGMIADCKIYENKNSGVAVSEDGDPKVSGCEIYNNLVDGVYVFERGQVTIADCKIHGNKDSNVENVGGNVIYKGKNDCDGIMFSEQ